MTMDLDRKGAMRGEWEKGREFNDSRDSYAELQGRREENIGKGPQGENTCFK